MPELPSSDASLFGPVAVGLVATTVVILRDLDHGLRSASRPSLTLLPQEGDERGEDSGEGAPRGRDLAA